MLGRGRGLRAGLTSRAHGPESRCRHCQETAPCSRASPHSACWPCSRSAGWRSTFPLLGLWDRRRHRARHSAAAGGDVRRLGRADRPCRLGDRGRAGWRLMRPASCRSPRVSALPCDGWRAQTSPRRLSRPDHALRPARRRRRRSPTCCCCSASPHFGDRRARAGPLGDRQRLGLRAVDGRVLHRLDLLRQHRPRRDRRVCGSCRSTSGRRWRWCWRGWSCAR